MVQLLRFMKNVFVLDNSLVKKNLSHLRDRSTGVVQFRKYAEEIANSLIKFSVSDIKDRQGFVVISILRSALALLPAAIKSLPSAKVGFAGLARNEETAIAEEYYWKVPEVERKNVLIPDPMLATGGSLLHVLRKIQAQNPKEIRVVNIITSPEGVEAIHKEFPGVKIYTAALDQGLDSQKMIVPGLGDFGDRYFGTI